MIDKLVPRYLNLEDDQRLVKSVEMTDALNVRLSSDEDGDGGVIKNAYGNAAISFRSGDELPAGTNKVIGSIANSDGGEVFFFVWNSNNDHSIYRYSGSSNQAQLVYRDSILDFSSFYHIRATVVRNLAGETLLYFTDANTEPKKINVTRALLGLYPASFTSGTDAEKLANIALAKQPPMTPPTFVFTTNVSLKQNNLYESTFQFAAQYVYQDGERSAISPYSELAVSQTQFFDGIITEEQKLQNNTLTISVPTSTADVAEIIVIARNGNAGAFYEIETIQNDSNLATQSIQFDNSKLYIPISQDEVNKIYDNVPQTAEAIDITGNRLMLGGYTEGYDNIRTDVDVLPNYFPEVRQYEIPVVYPYVVTPATIEEEVAQTKQFYIDISSIPPIADEESFLNISFALDFGQMAFNLNGYYVQWVQLDKITEEESNYCGLVANPDAFFPLQSLDEFNYGVKVKSSPLSISENIKIPAGTTKAQIVSLITGAIEGSYTTVLDSDITDFNYATRITSVLELEAAVNAKPDKWMFFSGSAQFSITESASTSTEVAFNIWVDQAALSAKAGYNFNVSDVVNRASNFIPIVGLVKSLFTRGKSLGQAYPATNALFNQIQFIDVPSIVYQGDGEDYILYTGTTISGGQFVPSPNTSLNTKKSTSVFLFGDDAFENGVEFDANVLTDGDINGYESFKAGAAHSFGLVYYDQFNRNGGVQVINSSYVNWYGDRVTENNLDGRVDTVLRIKHQAPSWAVKWAPVYAKLNSVTQKFQYSVIRAFSATNLQAKPFAGISSFEDVTYLSMRSLEGKSDSYKEGYSANLEYTYQQGDKLRIVSYNKKNGQYRFYVSATTGSVAVGDILIQFNISGVSVLEVTNVNIVSGSGTLTARLLSVSVVPNNSGALINVATGVTVTYTSRIKIDLVSYEPEINLDVLDYFEFTNDIDTNPILDLTSDEATFNTTGRFIAVKSSKLDNWNNYSIITDSDNWGSECIIEVYRPNKILQQEIFYEIGENFPVVNGLHVGQRTTISPVSANVVSIADGNNLIVYSNIKVYKGDILSDGAGNVLSVKNVYPEVNSTYNYVFYAATISGSFSATTYTLNLTNSNDAVVQSSNGDCYYRPRLIKVGTKAYANNFNISFIEDYSVSDFFSSKSTSVGRPHVVQPEAQTIFRKGSVTYSDAFIIDSKYLGLSSFNPSLANFYDFDYQHGTIKQLVGDDDRVYIIQQRKSGWAPIGRNIIESTDGAQSLTLSRSVVGVPNYYLGDYGINDNPESLAVDRGRIYFADVRTGKIVRISRDGISLISEEFMDAFFKDNFLFITNNTSSQKVIAGVDIEADEYIVSVDAINNAVISVESIDPEAASYSYTAQTNAAGTQVIVGLEFDDDDLFTFSTEIREFQDICDEFDDSLNAIVFLDKIIDGQPAYVGEEYLGQSGTIYGVATNTNYNFFVTISLNISTGEFSFSNDCGNYDGVIGTPTNLENDFTVSYDVTSNVWNTFYSYRPESIVSVDDTLFTFFAGVMYKHSDAANRSTYYGNPYNSVVEVISNQNPSMVKSYEAISLEGTNAWAADVSNTDQSTSILAADFSERERNWYAYVPRDSSANTGTATITSLSGSSEVFVLGNVATGGVSGSTITFTTPVGDVPFPMGGSLYKVSGATLVSLSLTVSSISGDKQVTASGSVTGVNNGDTIVVIGNGAIEGDQIRDYYAKIKLTNSSTSEIELYAVNMVFAKSNLHNQLGQ
jgi:hypothetical protein